jgi:hypothetical protein
MESDMPGAADGQPRTLSPNEREALRVCFLVRDKGYTPDVARWVLRVCGLYGVFVSAMESDRADQ